MENTVLDFATETLLKELGCTIKDNGHIAAIQFGSKQLKLEKRAEYWCDIERNLQFYSRAHIVIYMAGSNFLGGVNNVGKH
nr:MAG TPA: hypothetical protein [Caudoviricetes sp.]